MSVDPTLRLHTAVAAACPIVGISIGTFGVSSSVTFQPTAAATPAQIAAGQNAIDTFDWSQVAQDAFDLAGARTQTTGFLSAQIQRASMAALVRAVVLLALDEFNTHTANSNAILAAAAAATSLTDFKTRMGLITPLPTRTKAQLLAAMTAKIGAGDTDA